MTPPPDEALVLSVSTRVRIIALSMAAKVWDNPLVSFDDLFQEGMLAVCVAVPRYEPVMQSAPAFFGRRAAGAMQDYLRRIDHLGRRDRNAVKAGLREDVVLVPLDEAMG